MLQLHRTLHCSTSVSLGHLTTGPSWPLVADEPLAGQERGSTVNMLPGPRMLCRNAKCSVGKVRP